MKYNTKILRIILLGFTISPASVFAPGPPSRPPSPPPKGYVTLQVLSPAYPCCFFGLKSALHQCLFHVYCQVHGDSMAGLPLKRRGMLLSQCSYFAYFSVAFYPCYPVSCSRGKAVRRTYLEVQVGNSLVNPIYYMDGAKCMEYTNAVGFVVHYFTGVHCHTRTEVDKWVRRRDIRATAVGICCTGKITTNEKSRAVSILSGL